MGIRQMNTSETDLVDQWLKLSGPELARPFALSLDGVTLATATTREALIPVRLELGGEIVMDHGAMVSDTTSAPEGPASATPDDLTIVIS